MASRSRNSKYQVQLTDSVVKQVDEGGDSGMGTATENSNGFKECGLEKVEKSATNLGIGALMGWMGLLWSQGGFAPGKAVHLTQEQAEALRWANSAEGKFARNLMKWNADSLTDLECKKDVRRLGVTLEVAGRAATSG